VPGVEPAYFSQWLPGSVLTGVGNAMAFPILTGVAVSSLPYARFATGAAVNATARQVGAVLGVAIIVAILGGPDAGQSRSALLHGFWFTAAAGLLTLVGVLALDRHTRTGPSAAGASSLERIRIDG